MQIAAEVCSWVIGDDDLLVHPQVISGPKA
jgi:hypothetical protein